MIKREATFQSLFGRWLKAGRWTHGSASFELKRTQNHSLALSEIQDHQIQALLASKTGLYYKIPDDTIAHRPFDCFFLSDTQGYVVIAYGKRLTGFYMIPVSEVHALKQRHEISISEGLAKEIGTYYPIR